MYTCPCVCIIESVHAHRTPSSIASVVGLCHRGDAHEVVEGELVAVQDPGPGVAIAAHDGGTAVPHALTQAAARGDHPDVCGIGNKEDKQGGGRELMNGLSR